MRTFSKNTIIHENHAYVVYVMSLFIPFPTQNCVKYYSEDTYYYLLLYNYIHKKTAVLEESRGERILERGQSQTDTAIIMLHSKLIASRFLPLPSGPGLCK